MLAGGSQGEPSPAATLGLKHNTETMQCMLGRACLCGVCQPSRMPCLIARCRLSRPLCGATQFDPLTSCDSVLWSAGLPCNKKEVEQELTEALKPHFDALSARYCELLSDGARQFSHLVFARHAQLGTVSSTLSTCVAGWRCCELLSFNCSQHTKCQHAPARPLQTALRAMLPTWWRRSRRIPSPWPAWDASAGAEAWM